MVRERINKYLHPGHELRDTVEGRGIEHEVQQMDKFCDFKTLDNVKMDKHKGENGLYCSRLEYSYNLDNSNQLTTVLEKKFEVVGAENEAVTYLFDMTLGFDFVTTG